MNINNEAYKIVRGVLSDNEGHPVSELHEALTTFLGLRRSQSTSKIHCMVVSGKIDNYERGMYRLVGASENSDATNKTYYIFKSIKTIIHTFRYSGMEALEITENDREALHELQNIYNSVNKVLASYEKGGNTNK